MEEKIWHKFYDAGVPKQIEFENRTIAQMLGKSAAHLAIVLIPNPRDIPTTIRSITKHRVTILPAVPAIFNAINQHPGIEKIDISSVKACISGSAPLPPAVLERFE